ncbi:MAG TPA: hypothetical protein VN861_03115 [Candidatus Acidoferrales bacterium]|nr:hypothetical protein [Candidatus Acidoferrales bacterium]
MALSLPALADINLSSLPLSAPDDFMFHGWRCVWGGWRDMPNMDVRVGFWTAYGAQTDTWHLYSAWPGAVGPFVRGAQIDISLKKDQIMPDYMCFENDLKWFRNECLERLKRMIVKAGPPPFPIDAWWEGKLIP